MTSVSRTASRFSVRSRRRLGGRRTSTSRTLMATSSLLGASHRKVSRRRLRLAPDFSWIPAKRTTSLRKGHEEDDARRQSRVCEALTGWRSELVNMLRSAVPCRTLQAVKWGHLVYSTNGPVLLIRAEDGAFCLVLARKRLVKLNRVSSPAAKYEMATLEFREGMTIKPAVARRRARRSPQRQPRIRDWTPSGLPGQRRAVSRRRHSRRTFEHLEKRGR